MLRLFLPHGLPRRLLKEVVVRLFAVLLGAVRRRRRPLSAWAQVVRAKAGL
jgi:hypothetical protein